LADIKVKQAHSCKNEYKKNKKEVQRYILKDYNSSLMQKCHTIIVTGKVQDIGFRSVVEHIGRSFGMPGLVFNAKDGSVKILCCGEDNVIDNFTQTIRVRGEESGAKIKDIKEILLPFNIDLPDEFSKVSSDDEFDLGRKLDKGNFLLNNMNVTLNNMSVDNKTGFNNLNLGLTDIKTGLNNLTTMMYEHNTRLEAILEKLANK
jgi:acylphosphatase